MAPKPYESWNELLGERSRNFYGVRSGKRGVYRKWGLAVYAGRCSMTGHWDIVGFETYEEAFAYSVGYDSVDMTNHPVIANARAKYEQKSYILPTQYYIHKGIEARDEKMSPPDPAGVLDWNTSLSMLNTGAMAIPSTPTTRRTAPPATPATPSRFSGVYIPQTPRPAAAREPSPSPTKRPTVFSQPVATKPDREGLFTRTTMEHFNNLSLGPLEALTITLDHHMRTFLQIYHNFGQDQLSFICDSFANIRTSQSGIRASLTHPDARYPPQVVERHAIRPLVALGMTQEQAAFFSGWVLGSDGSNEPSGEDVFGDFVKVSGSH